MDQPSSLAAAQNQEAATAESIELLSSLKRKREENGSYGGVEPASKVVRALEIGQGGSLER